jgi:urease accessory protein
MPSEIRNPKSTIRSPKPAIRNPQSAIEWLAPLLQTNDSVFPSGTYAHSFGLEGLVQLGQAAEPATFAEWLRRQVMPALEHFELPLVRLAHQAAQDADVARLLELDERCEAMKGALELRQASRRIGAQRLQIWHRLVSSPLLARLEEERANGRFQAHAPIVFGAQTAVTETPLEAALISYYYQTLAALVSAAMKLIRMGQFAGQSLLTECLGQTRPVVERSHAIAEADLGWFQPTIEIASARHETADTRIFIS